MITKVTKTEEEWRAILTPEQYHIMREHGTEKAGTCEFNQYKGSGVYSCAACGLPLFKAWSKFESGTGWPSFTEPAEVENIVYITDLSSDVRKGVEVRCASCDSHLGHVFEDGPTPKGLRFCINGLALTFKASEEAAVVA